MNAEAISLDSTLSPDNWHKRALLEIEKAFAVPVVLREEPVRKFASASKPPQDRGGPGGAWAQVISHPDRSNKQETSEQRLARVGVVVVVIVSVVKGIIEVVAYFFR